MVGDIHIHGGDSPEVTATRAAEAVRTKILTSGSMRGAVVKAANQSRWR